MAIHPGYGTHGTGVGETPSAGGYSGAANRRVPVGGEAKRTLLYLHVFEVSYFQALIKTLRTKPVSLASYMPQVRFNLGH